MGTRDITYVDPTSGLPTTIQAEDADLFGAGDSAARPASGDYVGDLWMLVEGGSAELQRWDGSTWATVGTGGLDEATHEALDTLTHNLAEGCYTEITRSAGLVSDVSVYTDSGKATLVRKFEITRSGGLVTQTIQRIYDGAGAEITAKRITTTYNRTGGLVTDWTAAKGT